MTGYELSRQWFDFAFENPEKINPNHTAMYFFAIEHCNRLGWKKKFGFPSTMAMEAMGVKSYNTYKKTLDDLVDWGFFKMVERSKNQYSSNVIALSKNDKALDKALDKAMSKHSTKQSESKESINKQTNKEPLNKERDLSETEHDALEVCEHLLSAITDSDPDHRYNSNPPDIKTTSWLTEVDRAIRLDGRSKDDLMHLISILFYDNNNVSQFWRPNVESGKKLRSQFDKIRGQLQRLPKFKQNNHDQFVDQLFA